MNVYLDVSSNKLFEINGFDLIDELIHQNLKIVMKSLFDKF